MISDNQGNRLQNYALQEVLSRMGNQVETLRNPWCSDFSTVRDVIKPGLKEIIYSITKHPERYERKYGFEIFNKKYIKLSNYWLNKKDDLPKAASFYDMFVCGSDQIWNSEAKEITGKYFADFAPDYKRASYAASFGIDNVVPERVTEFRKYLENINYLSVREEQGVKIIEDLLGKTSEFHLDPTLLLTSTEWDRIASPKVWSDNKYIFCYFLGKPSSKLMSQIELYADREHLDICYVCNELNSKYNNISPNDFVSMIKGSEFVLTDSFHGTVFSILYQKPFYSFTRYGVKKGMTSRITSLLNLFNLQNRFDPTSLIKNDIYNIDYTNTNNVLVYEREKSLKYLRNVTSD